MSVDGAWRGTRRRPDGSRQRWALAIGHACTPDGPLTVTFTRRAHRTTIHPATMDGLWVAAVIGHYTAARCYTPATALGTTAEASHHPATATLNLGPGTRARNHKPRPRHLLHKPGTTRAGNRRVPGGTRARIPSGGVNEQPRRHGQRPLHGR